MRTETDAALFLCVVCGEAVSEAASAECNWCGRRYHLNQRNNVEGKDCGRVWIDEQFLALQFACDSCLKTEGAEEASGSTDSPVRPAEPRLTIGRRRRYRKRE